MSIYTRAIIFPLENRQHGMLKTITIYETTRIYSENKKRLNYKILRVSTDKDMVWLIRKKVNRLRRFVSQRSSCRPKRQQRTVQLTTNIVVIGAQNTGKTMISRRLTEKDIPDLCKKVTDAYNVNMTTYSDDEVTCKHKIVIHDTPGSLRKLYPLLFEQTVKSCDYYIITISLNDITSITSAYQTISIILEHKNNAAPICVFANKRDLVNDSENMIKGRFDFYRYVSGKNYQIIELSAKDDASMNPHWIQLLEDIENRYGIYRKGKIEIIEDE